MRFKGTLFFITAGLVIILSSCSSTGRAGPISDEGYLPRVTEIIRTQKDLIYNYRNMYHPVVLKEQLPGNEGYPYTMWFFGWSVEDANPGYPGCDANFVARGKDLYTWEVYSGDDVNGNATWDATMNPKLWVPNIVAQPDKWYDNWHTGDTSVVKKDGMFYAMLSSYASGPDMRFSWEWDDVDGDFCCIMGATSADGIHWTKSPGPVLFWEPEINKIWGTGIGIGPDGRWVDGFFGCYHRPTFIFDEDLNKWRMWHDYIERGSMSMGYAEAEAGTDIMLASSWKKINELDNPMYRDYPNPDVIKIDGRFYGVADPYPASHGANPAYFSKMSGWVLRHITFIVSEDGYKWKPAGWIQHDSDATANQVPCLYYEDGTMYVFYAIQDSDFRCCSIRVIEIKKEVFEKW